MSADGCETELYDEVVVAAHADQALAMLDRPTAAERDVLGAVAYQPNQAVLHTDTSRDATPPRRMGLLERPPGARRPRRRA